MTEPSINPNSAPSGPLYARQSAQDPQVGTARGEGGPKSAQAGAHGLGRVGLVALPRALADMSRAQQAVRQGIDGITRTLKPPEAPMSDQPTPDPVELMARALAGAAVLNPKRNALAWHSLGDAGRDRFREQARRIVNTATPDDLREQYAAAIRPNMLMGLQDAELLDEPGTQRINEWVDWIATELAAVRDTRVEELTARAEKADAAIEQVRALAKTARVATWQACTCDGRPACGCPSRPVAWKLNPGDILDALEQPQEGP